VPPVDAAELLATRPAVTAQLAAEAARLKLPSLAFGIVTRGGLVYFVGLGDSDGPGTTPTPETVYRIGSITKTLTGVALLQLRDAGRLDLDDPVVKLVPELATAHAPTSDAGPIRLRHLVTHSSGLPRMGTLSYGDRAEVTQADLLSAAANAELEFAPGTYASYSNLAVAIAGVAVARASGEPYRAYVERHLLAPLGMTHTVWERDQVPPDRLARAWAERSGGFVDPGAHWRLGAAEAMGGLYSSVEDLARFVSFELSAWPARDGADTGPLRRSSVRESHLIAGFGRPGGDTFGVSWIVKYDPRLGWVLVHNGSTEGYHASVWLLPERGVAAIALGPRTDALDGLAYRALAKAVVDTRAANALGAPARAAFGQVRALLQDPTPEAVERAFAPEYLRATAPGAVVALFARVREAMGPCSRTRIVRADRETSAQIELTCARGVLDVTLDADAAPPHVIRGLGLSPRAP
jgi:CubicO group peptidase (beta-lactamase class C family)